MCSLERIPQRVRDVQAPSSAAILKTTSDPKVVYVQTLWISCDLSLLDIFRQNIFLKYEYSFIILIPGWYCQWAQEGHISCQWPFLVSTQRIAALGAFIRFYLRILLQGTLWDSGEHRSSTRAYGNDQGTLTVTYASQALPFNFSRQCRLTRDSPKKDGTF